MEHKDRKDITQDHARRGHEEQIRELCFWVDLGERGQGE